MKTVLYLWRMARRRKESCALAIISTMIATIFMLFYPSLIETTRVHLDETYDAITVTGSICTDNSVGSSSVPHSIWQEMQESGNYSNLLASSSFRVRTFPKRVLEEKAGGLNQSEQVQLLAFQSLLMDSKYEEDEVGGLMRGYNTIEASEDLIRIRNDIRWLDGYDESCLESGERICVVPGNWGYELADTIPLLTKVAKGINEIEGIIRLKVVGLYDGKITDLSTVMPLKTMEDLNVVANAVQKQNGNYSEWVFGLDDVFFTIKDNRQLTEIKTMLIEKGLCNNDNIRVRVDDRVLKEAVEPIESNLAQLEGSCVFFFVMVTAIGFFISFLLTRGRKAEYAVMRLLGESRLQITIKTLVEQCVLCFVGVLLGAMLSPDSFQPTICATVLLCYTLGAAAAVLLTIRVDVLDILRDKE